MVSNVENLPQYFQIISDIFLLFRVVLRISEPLVLVCWGIHRLKTKMLDYGDHERFYFNEVARSKFEVFLLMMHRKIPFKGKEIHLYC